MPHKVDYAYIAGFLDADGTITVTEGRTTKKGVRMLAPIVAIYNGHRGTLEWMQNIFNGLGRIYEKPRPKKKYTMCSYLYLRNQEEMYKVLPKLIPYLRRKKKQAELLLLYLKSRFKRMRWKHRRNRLTRHLPTSDYELYLATQIREENKKYSLRATSL